MGEYTPNIKLYKPSIGETEWGDLVNNNFDVLDEQIDSIKKELITMAIKILMNQAVAHAISKDFYSIIADVITLDYPKGFKNTFESVSSPIEYEITIDNSNNPNDLTDYQILLEINNDEQFFEDCNYNKIYLEFYDEDKTTLLNHYVEEWDTENYNAKIWIKVPNIPANSTKKIYLKINVERTEDLSNPNAVFDLWDVFEGDSLDTEKWEVEFRGNSYSVSDGILHIDDSDSGEDKSLFYSKKTIDKPFIVEMRARGSNSRIGTLAVDKAQDFIRWHWLWLGNKNALSDVKYSDTTQSIESYEVDFTTYENEWHYFKTIFDGDHAKGYVRNEQRGTESTVEYTFGRSLGTYQVGFACYYTVMEVDWIKVRKYTDPEPTVTYTRNVIPVDYVTVTFDFPEGVDKLLVTTDSDVQNVYYSTDDGNTWNPIERDTETELPETAYSIKLKFEQATYMRGYAFLTW